MFVIPVHPSDLLLGTAGRFCVVEETKPGKVKTPTLIGKLEDIRDTLAGGDAVLWWVFVWNGLCLEGAWLRGRRVFAFCVLGPVGSCALQGMCG
jgi:hypothetical protein